MIVYRLMEFARGDGTDIPAFVRGNENGRGERHGGKDIHDEIDIKKPNSKIAIRLSLYIIKT